MATIMDPVDIAEQYISSKSRDVLPPTEDEKFILRDFVKQVKERGLVFMRDF